MHLPFPHGQAKICALDLASDCRKLGKQALDLRDAINKGDATHNDILEYETLIRQIEGLSNLVCVDTETLEEFRVGDYVTARRQLLANARHASLAEAYARLTKWLH